MKKLNDCFVQSLSQLKHHRTFEKWLEFLCIVHQSIELTEGVQLTMSENSTCVLKFGDHCENAVDILFAAYNESSPTSIKKLGLMEGQSSSQIEHYNLKIQHLEQELFEKSARMIFIIDLIVNHDIRARRTCIEIKDRHSVSPRAAAQQI